MLHDQINHIIVILLFGALVLLAFIHFANPLKVNKKGNIWFAMFLLLYSSFWLEEIAAFSGVGEIGGYMVTLIHMIQIFTAPVLYLSIVYYTELTFRLNIKHWFHFIIPIVYITIGVVSYYRQEVASVIFIWSVVIMLVQAVLYTYLSYFKIKQHQQKILIYSSNTAGIELKWLKYIVLQIIFLCVIVILHNIFISTSDLNAFVNGVQLVTVFFIAYFSCQQKEIYPVKEDQKKELQFVHEENIQSSNKRRLVDDAELLVFKEKLLELMDKEHPYLDSELNLVRLAEMLSITPHQLSYIINTGFNENFFQFINKYRVERAKTLLCSNRDVKMLAIAFDAGFNSKTAFNTTFKKITHQTPSEYRRTCSDL